MRSLKAVLGEECVAKLQSSHLFIVGVGGIGCELLKVLPKIGVRRMTILDLDIIEETNLNRQFYFRKSDVKKYKAAVAKEKLMELHPNLEIVALCDSIYNSKYDVAFYEQFDCVIAAIDSNRGRRYVGTMCVKAKVPMVDGGTKQYAGQSLSVIRGIYQCHNCLPELQEHTIFDSCTLRSNPSRPAHCIAYAKNFYDCFFGKGDQGDILKRQFVEEGSQLTHEQFTEAAIRVFNTLFSERVMAQNRLDRGDAIAKFTQLTYQEALNLDLVVTNPPSTRSEQEEKKQRTSLFEEEKLWSLRTYAERFVKSCANTLLQQQRQPGVRTFEKDDDDCMTMVYCLTSLRTYNFMNRTDPKGSHKYLTYYEVKDSAGNIQPAISSTNSIAAATEITELLKIVGGEINRLCMELFRNHHIDKIKRSTMAKPHFDCNVCSVRSCYLRFECDFSTTTYGQLYNYLNKEFLGYGRDLMVLNNLGGWDSVVSSTNSFNLDRFLVNGVEDVVIEGMFGRAMDIRLGSDNTIPLDLNAYIRDVPGCTGLTYTRKGQNPHDVRECVLEFKRKEYQQHLQNISHELNMYGFN